MNTFTMPAFVEVLEIAGSFAFAVSGIRLASAKRFDWFGAYVVGLSTVIGGGTIRDVMLGLTPFWMTDPVYLICSAFALLSVIMFGKVLIRQQNTFFIFDSVGLALFTVVGIEKTLGLGYPFWVAIVMGTITGAAGGVIRDVLINEVPLIFRKQDIYALACVAGGLVYGLCEWTGAGKMAAEIAGGLCVLVVRILAAKYHLSLPALKGEEPPSGS